MRRPDANGAAGRAAARSALRRPDIDHGFSSEPSSFTTRKLASALSTRFAITSAAFAADVVTASSAAAANPPRRMSCSRILVSPHICGRIASTPSRRRRRLHFPLQSHKDTPLRQDGRPEVIRPDACSPVLPRDARDCASAGAAVRGPTALGPRARCRRRRPRPDRRRRRAFSSAQRRHDMERPSGAGCGPRVARGDRLCGKSGVRRRPRRRRGRRLGRNSRRGVRSTPARRRSAASGFRSTPACSCSPIGPVAAATTLGG